jgi:GTPase SAR1 family protein
MNKTDLGPEDNFHFVVLGNKCDLEHREVTIEEAEEFFKVKHGLDYFEVSAKDGKNVENVFS